MLSLCALIYFVFLRSSELTGVVTGVEWQRTIGIEAFDLVEREHMDSVLAEQKLSASDLVDRKTALNLGKLVAATNILSGSVVSTAYLRKQSTGLYA